MSIKIAMRWLALPLFFIVSCGVSSAEPAEYVKICSQYGRGWFYIPGTDTCINPKTGVTKRQVENSAGTGAITETKNSDLLNDVLKAKEGVALTLAMPNATVTPGHHFGAALNVGTFDGSTAVGIAGAWQANDNLTVNGALGVGDQGDVGGRGGVNFSW
jgi:hypothetical protein